MLTPVKSSGTVVYGLLAMLVGLACTPAAAESVRKTLLDLSGEAWPVSRWNTAEGAVEAAEAGMVLRPAFSGGGFEHFNATPPDVLLLPGDAKKLTVRYRLSDHRSPLSIKFYDGWGRDKHGGKTMKWDLPAKADRVGQWQTASFEPPAAWRRPLAIAGMGTHNFTDQQTAKSTTVEIAEVVLETDVSGVDPATGVLASWTPDPEPVRRPRVPQPPTTPLLSVSFSTDRAANLFVDERPVVKASVTSWHAEPLRGDARFVLRDTDGKELEVFDRALEVDGPTELTLPLAVERYGRYVLDSRLSFSNGEAVEGQTVVAKVPAPPTLTDAQRMASPYGLNVHGATDTFLIEPFRDAGIVWFRDYAFDYEWLESSGGVEQGYSGWPNYPGLLEAYERAGVLVVPVCKRSIVEPPVVDGEPAHIGPPDDMYRQNIMDFVRTFDGQFTHWEVSNEYDLHHDRFEDTVQWRNYGAYHRVTAEAVSEASSGRVVTVENGRANINPQNLRLLIERGDFDGVGVINAHYYCGTSPPELSTENYNQGDDHPTFLFDDLRAFRGVASADGKDREAWLTEWGWDVLAGPVVSRYEQSVYLPRGWMMMMAAGVDKGFWYYDFDRPEPKQIFDGMGLLSKEWEPNLVLCSLAGLTSVLHAPEYVGEINAGPNTRGYVFENDGRLVASLWTIEGDDGPTVTLEAEELRDYLGNAVAGPSVGLTMAPVYAVGLPRESGWYRQTAYEIASPHLVTASPGETMRPVVRVTNNRSSPIEASLRVELPEGWTAAAVEPVRVEVGQTREVELAVTVGPGSASRQRLVFGVVAEESGEAVKTMVQHVELRPALTLTVGRLDAEPGESRVVLTVSNRSDRAVGADLTLELPASWKASPSALTMRSIGPGQSKRARVEVDWSPRIGPDESAVVRLESDTGETAVRPLIPPVWTLRPTPTGQTMDGELDEWSAAHRLPDWMLGSDAVAPGAVVYAGWDTRGLTLAMRVAGSEREVGDPKSFWAGDAMELFVDTSNTKSNRRFGQGDHQFWFVPLTDDGRVYAGRWKRHGEIEATRYDLPGIASSAHATDDGYVMEFLLPAEHIEGYRAEAGQALGVNLLLAVKGEERNRSVFWPTAKRNGAGNPANWGSLILEE
ncbi:MAG: sugar-binding protein [Planctomycetota bacterium]